MPILRSYGKALPSWPEVSLKSHGDMQEGFSAVAPYLWNYLLQEVRLAPSVPLSVSLSLSHFFLEGSKHLFQLAFPNEY